MPSEYISVPSHLFTVRLWCEDLGDRQIRWRGQVKHVLSGETHYFREWQELEDQLQSMIARKARTGEAESIEASVE
jgi:hypothetical protein